MSSRFYLVNAATRLARLALWESADAACIDCWTNMASNDRPQRQEMSDAE